MNGNIQLFFSKVESIIILIRRFFIDLRILLLGNLSNLSPGMQLAAFFGILFWIFITLLLIAYS